MKIKHLIHTLFLSVVVYTSPMNAQIIADGVYQIYSEVNDEALASPVNVFQDDFGNQSINNLFATDFDPNDNYQLFEFTHQTGDVYTIKNLGTNLYVGLKDNWCDDDGEVIAHFGANDVKAQIRITQNSSTGRYLFQKSNIDGDCSYFDLSNGAPGAKIRTYDDTGNNQQFKLNNIILSGEFQIFSEAQNQALQSPTDVNQPENGDSSTNNLFGATTDSANNYQRFEFIQQRGNIYKIRNIGTTEFVGLKDNLCGNGAEVIARFEETDNNVEIVISQDASSGRYLFQKNDMSSCSYFDLGSPNAKLRTFNDTGNNQQFVLKTITPIVEDNTYRIFSEVNNEFLESPTDVNQDDTSDSTINNLFANALNINNDHQKFEFTYLFNNNKNEVYQIKNLGTDQYVGLKDDFCGNQGEVVARFDEDENTSQIIMSLDEKSGRFLFQKNADEPCSYFDVVNGQSGAKIRTFKDTGFNQQFRLFPVNGDVYEYDSGIWSPALPTGGEDVFIIDGTYTINSDIHFNSILVTNTATAEIDSEHILTLNDGLYNNGTFVFNSNASGSAQLGNATDVRLRGDIIVERFIPKSNRAFRYISSPVNTSGTINDNLQEGVNNPDQSTNLDPAPGFGTHITGSEDGNNGFDATQTGNPSMFEWDESSATPTWEAITSTNQTGDEMLVGDAYALMVRGDRSTSLNFNDTVGPATTLRFTGTLVGGDQSVAGTNLSTTSGNYNLIANPYQAIVDAKTLLESGNATDLNNNFIYVYDPTLGSQGGYATIDLSETDPSATPNNGNLTGSTNADENILPNQAFFVETTGTSPALTFKETNKNTGANFVDTFSDDDNLSEMHINLKRQSEDVLVDGVTARFDPEHTNTVNNADADEVWNFDEWVALFNSDTYLSIEKRATPVENDSLQIYTGNYQIDAYVWQIDMSNINREAVLVDSYLDTETPLNANDETSIAFDIDSNIPGSVDPFRFSVQFTNETLSINDVEAANFSVYPNPVTQSQFTVSGLQNSGNTSIQLCDMTGKLVFTTTRSAENEMTIHIDRSLSTGVYSLSISQNQAQYQSTLIISE